MGNPVTWFEINSKNSVALRDFYADLFGWQMSPYPAGGTMIMPVTDISGATTFAHSADPEGNVVGIYCPADR